MLKQIRINFFSLMSFEFYNRSQNLGEFGKIKILPLLLYKFLMTNQIPLHLQLNGAIFSNLKNSFKIEKFYNFSEFLLVSQSNVYQKVEKVSEIGKPKNSLYNGIYRSILKKKTHHGRSQRGTIPLSQVSLLVEANEI